MPGFGGRNVVDPNERRQILLHIATMTGGFDHPGAAASVPSPVSTSLWKKAIVIHVACHRRRLDASPEPLSRHWFDLACVARRDARGRRPPQDHLLPCERRQRRRPPGRAGCGSFPTSVSLVRRRRHAPRRHRRQPPPVSRHNPQNSIRHATPTRCSAGAAGAAGMVRILRAPDCDRHMAWTQGSMVARERSAALAARRVAALPAGAPAPAPSAPHRPASAAAQSTVALIRTCPGSRSGVASDTAKRPTRAG